MSLLGTTHHCTTVALLAPPMAVASAAILRPGFKLRPLCLGGTEGGRGGSLIPHQPDRKRDTSGRAKARIAARPWRRVIVLCMIAMALTIPSVHRAPRAPKLQRDGRAVMEWQGSADPPRHHHHQARKKNIVSER